MRRKIKNRKLVEADLTYSSTLVAQLINQVMRDGKRFAAQKIVYGAIKRVEADSGKGALEVLDIAIENAGPKVELRSRRIGGANYQVPYEVRNERRIALALRWIVTAARLAKGKPMEQKLFEEINNAVKNTGVAVKKKMDTHKMADANKAFAHFAW